MSQLCRLLACIAAVTFDITNTLIHCPRLAHIYSEVLKRHGVDARPSELRRVIPKVWQELSCSADPWQDRFTREPDGAHGWWHRFLLRVCQYLETRSPTRFASAELFNRFTQASSWEVYPDVIPALESLSQTGLRLGVVSNWDRRLPELLANLELAPFFDAILYSSACGVEKPHPLIFERCLRELGVSAGHAVHVGDQAVEDYEGAVAAGMQAVRIDRRGAGTDLRRLLDSLLAPPRTLGAVADVGRPHARR